MDLPSWPRPLRPAALPLLLSLLLATAPAALRAQEPAGPTAFRQPPWTVDLVSYSTTIWQVGGEYYFTLELPAGAGADLGGLTIQQTRGVDRGFQFRIERTRAFLGRPRREGAAVPVQASFEADRRLFTISFPRPVAPGSTITVALRPWANPGQADTYMFQVMAYPAGANPVPAALGFGTLRIYPPDWR